MARSRNRPPRLLGLILLAVLGLVVVLCARVAAEPMPDEVLGPASGGSEADPGEWPDAQSAGRIDAPPDARWPAVVVPRRWTGPLPVPVGDVVHAAYRAAGVANDPAASWRVRSRLGGLVPWISVRAGRDATWKDVTDPTLGYTTVFAVSASWHLDRLEFDPNEIRIAAIDVSRRRERRHIAAFVIHTYYLWLATRSDEVLAELDADTDGWFSQAVANSQKP